MDEKLSEKEELVKKLESIQKQIEFSKDALMCEAFTFNEWNCSADNRGMTSIRSLSQLYGSCNVHVVRYHGGDGLFDSSKIPDTLYGVFVNRNAFVMAGSRKLH